MKLNWNFQKGREVLCQGECGTAHLKVKGSVELNLKSFNNFIRFYIFFLSFFFLNSGIPMVMMLQKYSVQSLPMFLQCGSKSKEGLNVLCLIVTMTSSVVLGHLQVPFGTELASQTVNRFTL